MLALIVFPVTIWGTHVGLFLLITNGPLEAKH
jgi:hypothetical protein